MEKDDRQLVAEVIAGEEAAFELLVKKYLKAVYNFLYRFTSDRSSLDDLTQVTFIKAWKNIEKFDQTKNFKVWLFTIAKNNAFDFLKKKKTIPFSDFVDGEGNNKLENIKTDELLPDEILGKINLADEIEKNMEQIPALYRAILILHYKEDFTLQEIAEIMGKPYNTIKSQHNRALSKLKQVLTLN